MARICHQNSFHINIPSHMKNERNPSEASAWCCILDGWGCLGVLARAVGAPLSGDTGSSAEGHVVRVRRGSASATRRTFSSSLVTLKLNVV